jgi:peptidoglycan-N-acetylglucosamine deacetylase
MSTQPGGVEPVHHSRRGRATRAGRAGVQGAPIPARMMVAAFVLALVGAALPSHPAEAVTACSRGTIALTFDDGPHSTYTPKVLDILRARKAKATFFQVGTNVAKHPWITRRAHDEGHRIGNHTSRHENLTRVSDTAIRDTLRHTNRRIADTGAPNPTLVRPPYGATNSRVRAVIGDLGMKQVLWTVDPQDWRSGRPASTITKLVFGDLHDGANILLHDGVGNSNNTVVALPGTIDGIRSRGYCIGTLSSTGKLTPPVPVARISDTEIKEGAAGTTSTVSLTVTLSEPTSRSVSFAYTTANGTAVAGEDYTATSGTLKFSVGQTSKRITVQVKGDDLDESNEKFTLKLSKPAGATISRTAGTVAVLDDDPAPSVRIEDTSVTESAAGATTTVQVPVQLSAKSAKTVTVNYATRDATATAGNDYTATTGTLTFSPGQTTKHVEITIVGDGLHEGNESLTVRLGNPKNLTIARETATVRIVDADPPPPPAEGSDG